MGSSGDWQFHLHPNPLIAGLASAAARSAVSPFSVTKIYGEVGVPGGKMGPLKAAYWVRRIDGWKGFYRGNGVAAARLIPHVGITVAVYNRLYDQVVVPTFKPDGQISLNSLIATYTAGAIGGVAATTVTHPLDVLKVRLTLNPVDPLRSYYRGAQDALMKIVAQEGLINGVYRGFIFSVMGSAVFYGTLFAALEVVNELPWRRRNSPLFPLEWFIDPAVALTAAYFASHPLDVLRRKMMAYSEVLPKHGGVDIRYRNIFDVVVQSVRTNGFWGFYHGWMSNSLKVVPQLTVLMLLGSVFRRLDGNKRKIESGKSLRN